MTGKQRKLTQMEAKSVQRTHLHDRVGQGTCRRLHSLINPSRAGLPRRHWQEWGPRCVIPLLKPSYTGFGPIFTTPGLGSNGANELKTSAVLFNGAQSS